MSSDDKARFSAALLSIRGAMADHRGEPLDPATDRATVHSRLIALQIQHDALVLALDSGKSLSRADYERLLADQAEAFVALQGGSPGEAPAAPPKGAPTDADILSSAIVYAVEVAADARSWLADWREGKVETLRELECWMGQPDGAILDPALRVEVQPDLPGIAAPEPPAALQVAPPPPPKRRGRPPGSGKSTAAGKARAKPATRRSASRGQFADTGGL
jgi:hypothetical protein